MPTFCHAHPTGKIMYRILERRTDIHGDRQMAADRQTDMHKEWVWNFKVRNRYDVDSLSFSRSNEKTSIPKSSMHVDHAVRYVTCSQVRNCVTVIPSENTPKWNEKPDILFDQDVLSLSTSSSGGYRRTTRDKCQCTWSKEMQCTSWFSDSGAGCIWWRLSLLSEYFLWDSKVIWKRKYTRTMIFRELLLCCMHESCWLLFFPQQIALLAGSSLNAGTHHPKLTAMASCHCRRPTTEQSLQVYGILKVFRLFLSTKRIWHWWWNWSGCTFWQMAPSSSQK